MADAILAATIKAYDEFTDKFQKLQLELGNVDRETRNAAQGTDRLNRSASDLYRVLGQVGVIYAFRRALMDVITTGSQLESTLTRVAAITGEALAKFQDMSMQSKTGLFAPRELATGFVDIAAAGFNSDQIKQMYGAIEQLAVGGMVEFRQAAEPTINVLKTWNLEAEKSAHIADAFVEASNATSLQVEDLSLSLAMSSAAAKLAGMDFEELLAVLGVLRDAGMQASDAGTSIKSALLGLMNPSKEAKDIMQALGIEVYDAQGKMKSWTDIVDIMSARTSGLDGQARNYVLTTIAGSDGIRALALSMNRGSDTLRTMTEDLKKADGVAQTNADQMRTTFAGAWKEATAELEKFKSIIFEDLAPALKTLAGMLKTAVEHLQSIPEPVRIAAEIILGAGGLFLAISALNGVLNTLKGISILASMTQAAGAMDAVAASAGTATGAVAGLKGALLGLTGIGAIAIPITLAYGAYEAYSPKNNKAWDNLFRYGSFNPDLGPGGPLRPEHASYGVTPKNIQPQSTEPPFGYGPADPWAAFAADMETTAKNYPAKTTETKKPLTLEELLKLILEGSGKGNGTGNGKKEDPFELAMAQFSHLTALEKLTYDQQVSYLEEIKSKYATTYQQRWEVEERLFDLQKKHAEDQKKSSDESAHAQQDARNKDYGDARAYYQYLTGMDRMSTEQRIDYMQRFLNKHTYTTEQEREAEQELHRLQVQLSQERENRLDDEYRRSIDFMDRRSMLAGMDVARQISYLERLRDAHQWTYSQMQDIEERLYRLRKQELDNYWSQVDDAYQEALDEIESRTETTVGNLQRQIDDLDNQGTQANRADAQQKHQQRLADLVDQRRYHELRTGKEHQKAVADLDKQIAEENDQWAKQQAAWVLEDKKEGLQDQIKEARDSAKTERDDLEEHYKEVKRIAKTGILDTVAGLAATRPEWLKTGETLIDGLIEGLKSGDFSEVQATLTKIQQAASIMDMVDSLNAQILDLQRQWWEAPTAEVKNNLHTQADALRSQIKALGGIAIPAFDKGGPVDNTGLIYAHQGEYIHTASETRQLSGLIPVLTDLVRALRGGGSGKGMVVNGSLVNIGALQTEDQQDVQILARELGRVLSTVIS